MGANKPSRTSKKIGWQQHNEALTEKYVKSTNAGARKKSHSPAAPVPPLAAPATAKATAHRQVASAN